MRLYLASSTPRAVNAAAMSGCARSTSVMTAERDRRVSRAMASSVSTITMGSDAQTCLVCHPVDLRRTARYTNCGFIILFTFGWVVQNASPSGSSPPAVFFLPQRDPVTGSGQAVPTVAPAPNRIYHKPQSKQLHPPNCDAVFLSSSLEPRGIYLQAVCYL